MVKYRYQKSEDSFIKSIDDEQESFFDNLEILSSLQKKEVKEDF